MVNDLDELIALLRFQNVYTQLNAGVSIYRYIHCLVDETDVLVCKVICLVGLQSKQVDILTFKNQKT